MAIEIRPSAPILPKALCESAQGIDFPTLGHLLADGFCDPEVRRIAGSTRVVGNAVTVRTTGTDSSLIQYLAGRVRAGDVVVVDTGGDRRHAPVGAVVGEAFAMRGVSGIVVDGVCTDYDDLLGLGITIYARGLSLLTTRLSTPVYGGINIPITCGGVTVNAGDVALADANGVMFAKREDLEMSIRSAAEAEADEASLLRALRTGVSLSDLTGMTDVVESARRC